MAPPWTRWEAYSAPRPPAVFFSFLWPRHYKIASDGPGDSKRCGFGNYQVRDSHCTAFHLTLSHFTAVMVNSFYLILLYLFSLQITSLHFTLIYFCSLHFISLYFMSPHLTLLHSTLLSFHVLHLTIRHNVCTAQHIYTALHLNLLHYTALHLDSIYLTLPHFNSLQFTSRNNSSLVCSCLNSQTQFTFHLFPLLILLQICCFLH